MQFETGMSSHERRPLGSRLLDAIFAEYLLSGDVLGDVHGRINKSLADYVANFVGIELARLLEEIKENSLEVPEVVRLRTIFHPAQSQITVEAPQITMSPISVSVPERSVHMDAPVVNVEQPRIDVNVEPTPIEVKNTVDVSPTPIEVKNSIHPEVNVDVNPTPIEVTNQVNVEKSDVNVQIQPTPVTVQNDVTVKPADVNIPRPVREVQQVYRDINQNIDKTVTDVEYKE